MTSNGHTPRKELCVECEWWTYIQYFLEESTGKQTRKCNVWGARKTTLLGCTVREKGRSWVEFQGLELFTGEAQIGSFKSRKLQITIWEIEKVLFSLKFSVINLAFLLSSSKKSKPSFSSLKRWSNGETSEGVNSFQGWSMINHIMQGHFLCSKLFNGGELF